MSLSFVNIHGHQISTAPVKATKPQPGAPDAFHKGWQVVGYSPEHLASGRLEHFAEQRDKPDPKPFDEVVFMRTNKPRPVRSKPYEVYEAAEHCAELAGRLGWKLVQAVAKTKGAR